MTKIPKKAKEFSFPPDINEKISVNILKQLKQKTIKNFVYYYTEQVLRWYKTKPNDEQKLITIDPHYTQNTAYNLIDDFDSIFGVIGLVDFLNNSASTRILWRRNSITSPQYMSVNIDSLQIDGQRKTAALYIQSITKPKTEEAINEILNLDPTKTKEDILSQVKENAELQPNVRW
jgi:hypothetical protein